MVGNELFVCYRTPIPVNVTEMMQVNEDDGLPEKNIIKQHQAQMLAMCVCVCFATCVCLMHIIYFAI